MVIPDPNTAGDLQGFYHIRILIGLVTGLSVTRILTGFARFVQHPDQNRVYAPHLIWSGFLLLYVFHFWWAEFGLLAIPRWAFQDFLFIMFYAALIFFTAALLYPDRLYDYAGFKEYFLSRRVWFFGLLLAILIVDIADTALKGWSHAQMLGAPYALRQVALIGIALAGLMTRAPAVHARYAGAAVLVELVWIFARFRFLE